jgi:hypothetical protein
VPCTTTCGVAGSARRGETTTSRGRRRLLAERHRPQTTHDDDHNDDDNDDHNDDHNDDSENLVTLIDDNVGATQGRATDTQNDEQVEAATPALRDTAKGASTGAATAQPGAAGMRVKKRSGALEPVDVNKIVNAIARASEGLLGVDPMRVATRTISALADGATTRELDDLSIRTAAGLIVEEPNYSRLASRLLATVIDKEVRNQNIPWFYESIKVGHAEGLVADHVL